MPMCILIFLHGLKILPQQAAAPVHDGINGEGDVKYIVAYFIKNQTK
jgi:hypothetical protein